MLARSLSAAVAPVAPPARPVLHLSGPRLRAALEGLVRGAEADGGVERYVHALGLKTQVFKEALGDGKAQALEPATFKALSALMAPVRRRIGPWLDDDGFLVVRAAIVDLLDGAEDTATTDERVARFCRRFPTDKKHRWVRDLAAEVLHHTDSERYPLMARWVWDVKANTGVLREIWHADNVDHLVLDVADGHETFIVLREELSQFLTDNGVFRDVPAYVDLLCAHVYADYIGAQGGSYLRTDFAAPSDPMQFVRRMLGLDGINAQTARTRLKDADGRAFVLDEPLADPRLLDKTTGPTDADS